MSGDGLSDVPRLVRKGPAPKVGIVHLGPGAFFRAFVATFTHDSMERAGGDWGILAVSLRSRSALDQLGPQGGVFTSVRLSQDARSAREIGAISRVMVAPENPLAVIKAMADPAVKIVSLTITEKGYCFDPTTGHLDLEHADIVHDLANPNAPKSAAGLIVGALAQRRALGLNGLTVLSCDNLPDNGALTRHVILGFAKAIDHDLANWIDQMATFPSTMVDRITPATTSEDIKSIVQQEGYYDPASVTHEGFRQWVIEDNFAWDRPAWDKVGAQFVTDVAAHEKMKLRCLNGTHSTLAYLGYLAGHETVSNCVEDPSFAQLCQLLWRNEIIPTLTPPEGEDMAAYCDKLLRRYANPSIRHRTWQIAMDGSQKLPQRILATIEDNLTAGRVPRGLCLSVAGWMRYVGGIDENGSAIDVRDPLAERLQRLASDNEDPVGALLSVKEVFSDSLSRNALFSVAVTEAYEQITRNGSRAAVAAFVESQKEAT